MPPARLDAMFGAVVAFQRWDPRSDAELLERFLSSRDESAFEALLLRHTPAVRAACRNWLRSSSDIDDAAQATFLVLVQRARSIRDRAALGRWLYRVAENVARRLRQQRRFCPMPDEVPAREVASDDGLRDVLTEEVARLPEKYRLPVQLCYAAGLTTAEAAQRLGWPKGTVLTRLAWARQRLQKCLVQRGVAPAALAGLMAAAPAVSARWLRGTAEAAKGLLAGESLARMGVSQRTISLTEGVVRAMLWNKVKYFALAALVAVSLAGFGISQWLSSTVAKDKETTSVLADPEGKEKKTSEPRRVPERRREAVIRLPLGTFVKEVDVAPYGSGRISWTYEEDRVLGVIEGAAMGGEIELATEAEYSLSSNGTIYGLLTNVRITHLRLPEAKEFEELKPFVGLYPAVEPLINEVLTDLPFSYQFRVQGDRLIISNLRMLLSGPNPLGKVGGFALGKEIGLALSGFQVLGTAIEGTYTTAESKEKPAPSKRPLFSKPRGQVEGKKSR